MLAENVGVVGYSSGMEYKSVAAWVPYEETRDFDSAAAVAIEWAEGEAAARGLSAILVTDQKGEYHGKALFEPFRAGRHASPRSSGVAVRPGAVIAHVPTPAALELAMRLARGNALVVVEHPSPWRLAGWAAMFDAQNLLTGLKESPLSPDVLNNLQALATYGNNGYANGFGRNGARRLLSEMHDAGQLDRDLVLSALITFDISADALEVIAKLIDQITPRMADH